MKILFIGGTGVISSACSQLAVENGIDLYLLNRGETKREIPANAKILIGDIRDKNSVKNVINDLHFDAVVNWIAFVPEHVQTDIDLFKEKTNQYIFISSASAYQTPPSNLPVTESTPLDNPFWEYSRNKIACEELLINEYRNNNFPVTIVRPSHTYDKTSLPVHGGYTIINRMREGKKVIVHGDGSSLWTLTHHRDFAKGFVGLLGNNHAIGENFHITSDEILTWNQINEILANAAGVKANIIHIPSDFINTFDAEWGAGLLGDKTHSMIFDNTKIKRLVPGFNATIPFCRGVEEIINWYDSDKSRQVIDREVDLLIDKIINAYEQKII
ncbi:MAG: NAD-dependent dehydratase [Ignavibacteria bacterium GWB2_35_6b]|nr:MAG: NAD-dependent dehydratase [Ignavibacteria bacterium GWB2_35_6b]